jgi:hypothetical protein
MDDLRFDMFLKRSVSVLWIALLMFIVVPALCIGYKFRSDLLSPQIDQTAVTTVNRQTGKTEYLSLRSFYRLQGTRVLVASLLGDGESYSSFKTQNSARNLLFFDLRTKKSRWLRQDHSALILNSHELVKDIDTLKKGSERDWPNNQNRFEDENAQVTSIIYQVVLTDTNGDRKLSADDKISLLFFSVEDGTLKTLIEGIGAYSLLGIVQSSSLETLIFYTEGQKNYVVTINTVTGVTGEKVELASVEAVS